MKKLFYLGFLLIFCFSNNTIAQTFFEGVVSDRETGELLPGANIILDEKAVCATNINGFFKIETTTGSHAIEVSFLGYNVYKKNITIKEGENSVNIKLLSNPFTTQVVVIAADGFKSEAMQAPVRIQTLKQKQIETLPAQKIEGVLQYASGVNVDNTLGVFSDQTVVSMRGMGGNSQGRMLVLMDGVPMNKSDGGSVNWNSIDMNNIDEVRVIKGAASTLYGANAMGGVIDIRTNIPSKKLNGDAKIQYGTYNTSFADFSLSKSHIDSLTNRGFYWKTTLHGGYSDGYIVEPEEFLEYGEDTLLEPSFLREKSGSITVGYALNAAERIDFSVKAFDDKRGKGWKVYDDDGSFSEHDNLNMRVRYHGNAKEKLFWDISGYGLFENYKKQNEYLNSDGDFSFYEVDSKRTDAGLLSTFRHQTGRQMIRGGVDLRYGSVNATDNYFSSTDSIVNKGKIAIGAIFLQDELNFFEKHLRVTAGIRYDIASFFDGGYAVYYPSKKINYLLHFQDLEMKENSWGAVTPRLSFLYNSLENYRIYGTYSRGFRPPTLDDMCRSSASGYRFRIANPDLGPETIDNFEIGGDIFIFNRLMISPSIYYSLGNDFMYEVSTGDSVNMGYKIVPIYKMDNISKMEAYGGELALDFQLFETCSFFGNYAYAHSTIKDFVVKDPAVDFDLTGKFLSNVPMHSASAGVRWENPWLSFNLVWKYKGERYINDKNIIDYKYFMSKTYPAYQTLSVRFWKNLPYRLRISLDIENITNEYYLDGKGRQCPGRMFMVELAWKIFE